MSAAALTSGSPSCTNARTASPPAASLASPLATAIRTSRFSSVAAVATEAASSTETSARTASIRTR
ncbi:Uncharacterised protein [Mycobacteroides abscessus subsp. abscessus]|nr:Uncharacterised protein [Mycobacteroides abscessus subsp. abscessus]